MGDLRLEDIEADGADLRAAGPNPVPNALFRVLREECLELALDPFVFNRGLTGPEEDTRQFGPRVRSAHVDDPDRLGAWPGRLDPEQPRRLAVLNATPEFF